MSIFAPVIGTDNKSPIQDPEGIYRVYNYDQLYLGGAADGKFVPSPNSLVNRVIADTLTIYRVVSIDPTTFVPVLDELNRGNDPTDPLVDTDLLDAQKGVYPHLFNLYVDRSVRPFVLKVDAHLPFYDGGARYARLFKGRDTSAAGTVISRRYTTAGIFESDLIEMQVASGSAAGSAIRFVPTFHTNIELNDDEICTLVIQDTDGSVSGMYWLRVVTTAATLPTDLSRRYVTGVRLVGPNISTPNSSVITIPLGFNISSLSLKAVVEYNDGQTTLPVDNTTIKVLGLSDVLTLNAGCEYPVQVQYLCASNEYNTIAEQGNPKLVTRDYTLKIAAGQTNYGFHLIPAPYWISEAQGYGLRWWLYSLDRSLAADVTQFVSLNTTDGDAWQPKGYGVLQSLLASVDVRNASIIYNSATHVERQIVVLDRVGTERQTNWVIGFTPTQNPKYGLNNKALGYHAGSNNWRIRVDSGYSTMTEWLSNLYYKTLPPYNTVYEAGPPEPNYFALVCGNDRYEYPIVNWNQPLLALLPEAANNKTIYVEFIRRLLDANLLLSRAPLPLYQTDAAGNYI